MSLKFSFLMIVFNGDDFLHQSLESVYDFAHDIFVIEGAVKEAWPIANVDGSSTDNTIQVLNDFPDPLKKIKIIHGKWSDKEEMTNALIKYVTGDYIWRLDSDEVYKSKDLVKIKTLLSQNPKLTHVTLRGVDFFHGFDRIMISKDDPNKHVANRIWKFEKKCFFKGHRPPDLYCPCEGKYMGKDKILSGLDLENEHGVTLYHYSWVTDKQVKDKMIFFSEVYLRKFSVGIPYWNIVHTIPVVRRFYRIIFSLPIFDRYRRGRSFPKMNFNYYSTVWKKWSQDREYVESKYGVTFNSEEPHITVPFQGRHPEVIYKLIEKL